MPASIANIAFLTALFFCQPMKINDAGLPGSIQPPWLEGDAEQQAFQFETEGFYSRGKWKSPGMFPTELSAAAWSERVLSQFPPVLPSLTQSLAQPLLSGSAELTGDPLQQFWGDSSEVTVGPWGSFPLPEATGGSAAACTEIPVVIG